MAFQVKKAKREKIYAKIALMAPSGGGKTYGSLRLATGMAEEIKKETGKDARILMVNTEQKRGYYYANEFDYDIIDLEAPYEPEKFVDVIKFAQDEGYDILILDSTSPEWDGAGGCLELQQKAGGTYQAWGKITPRHDRFIHAIADSPIHVIATMRGKDQYEMNTDEKGKKTVQKLGVGAKQRDGFEYEFTCTFLIDQKTSTSEAQKDNTHLFQNRGAILLSEQDGRDIIKWANEGEGYTPIDRNSAPQELSNDIDTIKKQIIAKATELGGSKNAAVSAVAKELGNPNKIDNIEDAKKYLEALNNINE